MPSPKLSCIFTFLLGLISFECSVMGWFVHMIAFLYKENIYGFIYNHYFNDLICIATFILISHLNISTEDFVVILGLICI